MPHGISDQVLEFTPLEQEITIHVYIQGSVLIFEKEIAEVISKKITKQLVKKIKLATLQLKTDQLLVNLLGQKHIINVKSINPILEISIKNQGQQLQLTKDDIQINWSAGSIQIKQIKRPMGALGWEQTKDTLMVKIPTVTGSVDYLEWTTDQFKATHSDLVAIPKTNTQPNELLKKDSHGIDEFGVYYDLTIKGVTQRLRYIPSGTFLMGTLRTEVNSANIERPQHPVTISRSFWLANTPCTQEFWQIVMGNNPSHFKEGIDAKLRPVENITFEDQNSVKKFLKKLQEYLSYPVRVNLPSEAQWEYACRAGTNTAYWWGNEFTGNQANLNNKLRQTTNVYMYQPNPWGFYDMHGNVYEWCIDEGLRKYKAEPEIDPFDSFGGDFRVLRGGSWFTSISLARSASRLERYMFDKNQTWGFRLILRS